jgi:hypothetical protein
MSVRTRDGIVHEGRGIEERRKVGGVVGVASKR